MLLLLLRLLHTCPLGLTRRLLPRRRRRRHPVELCSYLDGGRTAENEEEKREGRGGQISRVSLFLSHQTPLNRVGTDRRRGRWLGRAEGQSGGRQHPARPYGAISIAARPLVEFLGGRLYALSR